MFVPRCCQSGVVAAHAGRLCAAALLGAAFAGLWAATGSLPTALRAGAVLAAAYRDVAGPSPPPPPHPARQPARV